MSKEPISTENSTEVFTEDMTTKTTDIHNEEPNKETDATNTLTSSS